VAIAARQLVWISFIAHDRDYQREPKRRRRFRFAGALQISFAFQLKGFGLLAHTRGPQLFVHDQKRADAVKIICVPLAREVIGEIR